MSELVPTTWNDNDPQSKALALYGLSQALAKARPLMHASASDIYFDIGKNGTSITDSFNRSDYENFRPGERLPRGIRAVIAKCFEVYRTHGMVRNVIDLMSDFAAKGVDISHKDEKIEKEYRNWFRSVNGFDRSERFLHALFLSAHVFCYRTVASRKKKLPVSYQFLNPLQITASNEELSFLLGSQETQYGIEISKRLAERLRNPSTKKDLALRARLTPDVLAVIDDGDTVIPLDPKRLTVAHYKRNDWETWADPIIRPIFGDLNTLEKMRMADIAALDGAISKIRLWKLGSLEHKILPSETEMLKLAEILTANVGGGAMNLVWGPAIELVETSTDVHNFLGETKYKPVMQAIFGGLGIPPTLTGSGAGSSFTNNFISLKTLVERLEYGREALTAFWQNEFDMVAEAMGYDEAATLSFSELLTDETQEKQLLLNLADRDLISIETLQTRFGVTPEIERMRLQREQRRRDKGEIPAKASPFHDANHIFGLEKIYAQSGGYAPSEMGVELKPRKPNEDAPGEIQAENKPEKLPGQPGQGRPLNSKDTTKRKEKDVKVRRTASADFATEFQYVEQTQHDIAKILTPLYLKNVSKASLRELTENESREFEKLKFNLLCTFEDEVVTSDIVKAKLQVEPTIGISLQPLLTATLNQATMKLGKEISLDAARRLQSVVVATARCSFKQNDESETE